MTGSNIIKPAFEPGFKFYKQNQLPEDKQFMLNALSIADNGDGTTLIVGPEMYDYAVSWHNLGQAIKQINDQGFDEQLRMGKKKDWDRLEQCASLKMAFLKANPNKKAQRYWEATEDYHLMIEGLDDPELEDDNYDNAIVRYPAWKDEEFISRVSVSKDHLAFGRWFCDVKNFELLEP